MSKSMKAIDPDERTKIMQLQNESKTVDNKKVEWLYGGEKVDREAYLLGKPLDKMITESEKNEARARATVTVDVANKIRDDPLFEIKKMEIESRKRLLENPMRMKHLQEMISKRAHDGEKRKKHRRRSSSSESSSSERESDRRARRRHSGERARRDDRYGYQQHAKKASDKQQGYTRTEKEEETRREAESYKKRIDDLKKLRESKPVSSRHNNDDDKQRERVEVKKLSAEEKQRKLQQMSENAKWRNDERNAKVTKYRREDKQEDEEDRNKTYAPGQVFNSMMRDAYSSAEDRIKRNVKNIQRKESSYDSNFARR